MKGQLTLQLTIISLCFLLCGGISEGRYFDKDPRWITKSIIYCEWPRSEPKCFNNKHSLDLWRLPANPLCYNELTMMRLSQAWVVTRSLLPALDSRLHPHASSGPSLDLISGLREAGVPHQRLTFLHGSVEDLFKPGDRLDVGGAAAIVDSVDGRSVDFFELPLAILSVLRAVELCCRVRDYSSSIHHSIFKELVYQRASRKVEELAR